MTQREQFIRHVENIVLNKWGGDSCNVNNEHAYYNMYWAEPHTQDGTYRIEVKVHLFKDLCTIFLERVQDHDYKYVSSSTIPEAFEHFSRCVGLVVFVGRTEKKDTF